MDRKYLIGGMIGFIFGLMFIPIDASIPPTSAWKFFNVQTSPWASVDTVVESNKYNDQVFFVSDGSIFFNVTDSYP